ncbi:MAG: Minichromosome maintenance protein MCM, partial [Hadesarchaea archaeon]|nr:Minichromosome maintenance protein MCM [Hadesarchaea archaeon]
IVATLNTRTAVLAAANPKLGRFEKNLTIAQQVPLDPVILSRFDLVFIMRDEPRADQDRTIAHHILELHSERKKLIKPPINLDFLRKIIIYARQNLDPKLDNKEVMKTIEDFFVDWRGVAERGEAPLPITVRQLEAIVRLAKANARMRLSDRVTIEDANRAIMLIKRSLQESGIDTETGKLDIDVLMTGKPKSQRDNIRRVLDIIKELEGQYGGAAPVEEIKRIAESEGIKQSFVEELIEQEKMRGHLYEPKQGMVTRAVK